MLRGAYENNPVIAPTVNTLNKQALFKKRQEKQDRNNMIDSHLQGVGINHTSSNSQMQPWYPNVKNMNIVVEADSRNNSLLEKTNDSIMTDQLESSQTQNSLTKRKPHNNLASWELAATNGENSKELWCTSP